ncbi:uncharacterized protein BDR25DRAFT_356230 [Lindgomyces ingoldianus]|uniref:Uncharacterized protein n=1 Tax=Lindgomyces ingoldianus TaxID=673940 RepID=A0ACB6QR88_9PLEO|nr:uncharacterized protein BDR25DRAFT_356230 [Lindgomyces ingoldianus]KAF2469534.1 hypothetical protein BDR25DRAFT_356230 [Lindgomyces ingoldianus]
MFFSPASFVKISVGYGLGVTQMMVPRLVRLANKSLQDLQILSPNLLPSLHSRVASINCMESLQKQNCSKKYTNVKRGIPSRDRIERRMPKELLLCSTVWLLALSQAERIPSYPKFSTSLQARPNHMNATALPEGIFDSSLSASISTRCNPELRINKRHRFCRTEEMELDLALLPQSFLSFVKAQTPFGLMGKFKELTKHAQILKPSSKYATQNYCLCNPS